MRSKEDKNVLEFPSTAGFKKYEQVFMKDSIRHPAKANLRLLSWIIDKFTMQGDWILDPMAGTFSTCIIGALKGRNCVGVELEQKFVDMGLANKKKLERLKIQGKGLCHVLQGDSRNLSNIIEKFDSIITSPQYGEALRGGGIAVKGYQGDKHSPTDLIAKRSYMKDQFSEENVGNLSYGKLDAIVTSPPYSEDRQFNDEKFAKKARHNRSCNSGKMDNPSNIGNLPHGKIDTVITSPPFNDRTPRIEPKNGKSLWKTLDTQIESVKAGYTSKENIGNLPHGQVDAVISSPPYEASVNKRGREEPRERIEERLRNAGKSEDYIKKYFTNNPTDSKMKGMGINDRYSDSISQVGSMKGETYLQAMHQIYNECWKVLKQNGTLILIVKNFIRKKALVRLDLDTIKLCEHVGFTLKDRYYFKLPQQSFWRINYQKKYPDAPKIEYEDILIFHKDALCNLP